MGNKQKPNNKMTGLKHNISIIIVNGIGPNISNKGRNWQSK